MLVKRRVLKKKRVCTQCGKEKNLEEFYSSWLRNHLWHGHICLVCYRIKMQNRYRKNRHYWVEYRHSHPEVSRRAGKRCFGKLKAEVLSAYGGKCSCCGETELEFLTIEHKWHDGREHRERVKKRVYRDLRQRGYPKNIGIDVLCWNCNMATRFGEPCPHKMEER